jgi:hypothetical protein
VSYNNGSAAYNAANDGEALLNSVILDPTTSTGMGQAKRPEFNLGSYDWQALSYYIRRSTAAGTYPAPALPGPGPTDTTHAKISNVVATRLSFSSIQVTWDTDKPTIGLACGASDANYNNPFRQAYITQVPLPYSSWSPLEAGFSTTGHSATITWLPMSIPTHFSVVVKDQAGNSSYAQDQTIGIHPEGTSITGGTGVIPNNATKLVTNFGEWSFGQQVAPEPGYGGGAFYYVLLNGNNVDTQGLVPAAQQLRVDQGGNLFALTFDQLWFVWINGVWWANHTTMEPVPSAPPAPINPPYPISADGSTITGTTGSLTTAEGVWTIDRSGDANLNGTPLRNGAGYPRVAVTRLEVNAHGQMFLLSGGTWYLHAGNRLMPSTGPTSRPVPVNVVVDRSTIPTGTGIPHTSSLGTEMAVITVKISDGSAFSGSTLVSLDSQGNQSGRISGGNLVYNFSYPTVTAAHMNLTATQNGSSYIQYFHEEFT